MSEIQSVKNLSLDDFLVDNFISLCQTLSGESLSFILLIVLFVMILMLWRFFGKDGIYLYNILAVVVANIQVLKVAPSILTGEPLALGTLVFATTFLTSDILTEHYGTDVAKKGITLSFLAQIIVTILMLFTLAYPSSGGVTGFDNNRSLIDPVQASLYTLFAPSLRILTASLTAYYISQWVDIRIFKALKDYTGKKLLWLRYIGSTLISGLIDNVIFSLLAWVILSPDPVSFKTLFFTYILGTYLARIAVSLTSTPIIYMTYRFLPYRKSANEESPHEN